MKVKVTDTWGVNYQTEMERSVFIGSSAKKPQPPTVTESFVPTDFTLYPAYPNPFNPQTTLRYALPEASPVRLTIYNLQGAAIKTLLQAPQPAGVHSVSWDGTDYQGKIVPAGIYLCQLQALGTTQKFSQTQKLSLIK
jgi:hypothetical protein